MVKEVQTHHHKPLVEKRGVACRSNAPWAISDETKIVRIEENIDKIIVKHRKELIKKVLSYNVTISDLSDFTLSEILEECGLTAEQYDNGLGCVEKKYLYYN